MIEIQFLLIYLFLAIVACYFKEFDAPFSLQGVSKSAPLSLLMVYVISSQTFWPVLLFLSSALFLALIADQILIDPCDNKEEKIGIALFLWSGFCFISARFAESVSFDLNLVGVLCMLATSLLITIFFLVVKKENMSALVVGYSIVLLLLVISMSTRGLNNISGIGSFLFVLSDFLLVMRRFSDRLSRIPESFGLFLYFASQGLLVIGFDLR